MEVGFFDWKGDLNGKGILQRRKGAKSFLNDKYIQILLLTFALRKDIMQMLGAKRFYRISITSAPGNEVALKTMSLSAIVGFSRNLSISTR